MMLLLIISTLLVLKETVATDYEISEYSYVARTLSGSSCLTGCNANSECYINWDMQKASCNNFEVAPIYRTAQIRDPSNKYCLSNCGKFGEQYDWCLTTESFKWDFCNPQQVTTFVPFIVQTRFGKPCSDECRLDPDGKYYWCHFINDENQQKWEWCAPPSLPRVPVLRENFYIGEKKKGNCDGFLKYVSMSPHNYTARDAADNYVTDTADAIEVVANNVNSSQAKVVKEADSTPIEKYTVVKIKDRFVPAVLRAHITNATVGAVNQSMPSDVQRGVRKQMAGTTSSYEAVPLIGAQFGGPNTYYNVVPRSVYWKCEEWWDMEMAVKDWCHTTGGSVDMTVVVFYNDGNTPVPKAFGVSLVYKNDDNSVFVECRDKIHYNNF